MMTETALYRRYRPQTFDEVVGQDHVVSAIQGAVANNTFVHAYLFSGGRGTGKTSVARILATSIGVHANDLYEIDAASNRGIDDVRELREAVNVRPMESPYKLYIIDEVHMLTKEAFNALLKTLEEPPAHVVFVLATTECEALPDTVVSRCQHFTFNQPTRDVLCDVVKRISQEEGYHIDTSGADLVAVLGEGSFRDTLGVLQKIISGVQGKKITEEYIAQVTRSPQNTVVNTIVKAIGYKTPDKALMTIRESSMSGIDMRVLTLRVLKKVRTILLLRFAPDMKDTLLGETGEDEHAFIQNLVEDTTYVITSQTITTLIDASRKTQYTIDTSIPLEIAILQLTEQSNVE